ncbi:ankyrin repeat domain-containing protein [Pochonia chlamydosporia 170]|uniref:Ankyrin repeat domain-containing protein n=1 Tax=Pochonia chlamydosporia 170 TaxID=1380566 RepID=A0A179F7S6_METCM|nr:ankyrin repeat domain-containing protein [Pochonia chlamydosporia 170]OAQ61390.1 ankyrin repeat domain-containing protein [Pochonia chlamydosporia 170]
MGDTTSENFLRVIVDPDDACVDIVAVHGLNPFNTKFHAERTWTVHSDSDRGALWLRDFLPKQLPNARVMLFGYNSNVAFETSISGVREQASNLLNRLQLKRRDAANRPIVFIAHSLGGIVVKQALVETKLNPTYEVIGRLTYGIAFFGTPHQGSDKAGLGEIVATVTRAVRRDVPNSFMESLKKDTLFSNELIENFKHQLEDRHIISFFETKPYKKHGLKLGLIVDKKSATLGLPGTRETSIGLDSDHDEMCKFASADDDMYEQVAGNIIQLVERAVEDAKHRQRLADLALPIASPGDGNNRIAAQEQLKIAKDQLQAQVNLVQKRTSDMEQECHQLFRLTNSNRDITYEWYKDQVRERVDGTCMWLLEHKHFQSWLTRESGPLLITADPGCGKSVLAKYLIDYGLPQSSTICYFFFKDHDQNTVRQALCALLHQLFNQKLPLIKYALPYYIKHGKGLINSTRSLWEILQMAINNNEAGPVIVVLDALDECAELDFANLMQNIRSQVCSSRSKHSKLKYLLTSRPYNEITSKFRDLLEPFPSMRIPGEEDSETISQEVNRVITYRVNQLRTKDPTKGQMEGLSPEIKRHLKRRLQKITHRTYLWVHLMFDYLDKEDFKRTKKGVDSAITAFPRSINEAYEQILNKSKDDPIVRKTLCIMLAASRPLTLAEMNIAVNLDNKAQSIYDLDLESEEDFITHLRSWCGLFISVHDGNIYFLHQTAREFLLADLMSPSNVRPQLQWYQSITIQHAHAVFAEVCLLYLNLFNSGVSPPDTPDTTGSEVSQSVDWEALLDYAATHWVVHLRKGDMVDNSAMATATLKVCDPNVHEAWFDIYWEPPPYRPKEFTNLMMASFLGLKAVAMLALEGGAETEAKDSFGRTSLHWAAYEGHEAIVEMLLDKGVDINAHDANCGCTPLWLAASKGHESICRLLVYNGAHIDATDNCGQTPLLCAAMEGHCAVVNLLASDGADVEAKDKHGWTALLRASTNGHDNIVKLLTSKGAKLEAREELNGRTSLLCAAGEGHCSIVEIFLRHGADIEDVDKHDNTPLLLAAWSGYAATVEILLKSGANTESKDCLGGSSLLYAVENGHIATVQYLLDYGAKIESKDDRGRTVLQLAQLNHDEAIITLLQREQQKFYPRKRHRRTY